MTGKFRKKVLPWITKGVLTLEALLNFACKGNPVGPDSAPYFTSSTPTAETTQTNIGNSHTVRGNAEDPDGDSFDYKTLKDGTQVNNTNEYTFTIDKKGMTKIQIVAYNILSDTLTKYFSANNQAPTAIDTSITIPEDGTRTISKNKLINDSDGDETTLNITSTDNVNATVNNNGDLEITGLENYFGPASVSYSGTDGEATDNGQISIDFTNTQDDPQANAGEDKAKTIDEEIGLDGSASNHPDSPLSLITNYEWSQISGPNVNIQNGDLATANFTANTEGEYEFQLKVTDDKGYEQTDNVIISIDSDKITVNATNVLTDAGISGLEVMLAGKTTFTDNQGKATLEYPTNTTIAGNLQIQDEDIVGDIGDFFNYSDTESMSVNEDKELNIEMIPNVEFNSQFYTDIFDFLTQINGNSSIGTQPGDYPENYPILVNKKQSEMPADYYNQAVDEAIELINQTLGWEVFRETTGDDARYIFDYTRHSSRFSPDYIQKDGVWYIDTATVYINKNALNTNSWFEILKGEITHELFTHGLGWSGHSEDSQDVSNTPVWDSDITTNEKNAKQLELKLQGGTKLKNYEIE